MLGPLPLALHTAVTHLPTAAAPGQEAAPQVPDGDLPQPVVDACNITGNLPSPGADGDFVGPMLRASTPLASYAYYR